MIRIDTQKKIFNFFYFAGVGFGIALIIGLQLNWWFAKELATDELFMLYAPPAFICLLFLMSISQYWLKYSGQIAGTKVQTAGYLYTLIGAVIAMLQMKDAQVTVADTIAPIGAALLTSLIGWFLGSFISDDVPGGHGDATGLDTDLKHIKVLEKAALDTLSTIGEMLKQQRDLIGDIHDAQTKYINTIRESSEDFASLKSNIKPIEEALSGMKDLAKYLSSKDVIDDSKALPKGLKELNTNLRQASANSAKAATLLDGIDQMVNQYMQLMKNLDEKILK